MKKIIVLFVILSLFMIGMTSCKSKADKAKEAEAAEEAKKQEEQTKKANEDVAAVEAHILTNTPKMMIESTDLITSVEGYSNVTIKYEYDDEEVTDLPRNPKKKESCEVNYTISSLGVEKKGTLKVTVYPRTMEYVANSFISQVPTRLSESIDYISNDYLGLYTISWSSGDTSVLTDEGKYIKPTLDTDIVISYTVTLNDDKTVTYSGSFNITVVGVTDEEKVTAIVNWLNNEVETNLAVTSNMNLPSVDNVFGVALKWTTSNPDIIKTDGTITRYVYDRYAEIKCNINVGDFSKNLIYWIKVKALDTSSMSQAEIVENYVKSLAVSEIKRVNYNVNSGYQNITQSYNVINFYDNAWAPVTEYICPFGKGNRPGTIKTKKYVVVHDTANNRSGATAYMHAQYVAGGGGGTSFQYVVGNDGIYRLIPDNEVAYHAGDGTKYDTKLYDTGVKAISQTANIAISDDNYFTFNGVKSKIKIPEDTVVRAICTAGLYYEVGVNGNYWLNENYYNSTYQAISNRGGNNNSIGIETCVDQGTNYFYTYMLNANNVARLCYEHDIAVDCVLQHNNFSNKPCPYAIREAGTWQPFRDFVSQILYGMTHFKGLTFEWHSSSEILSSTGYISKNIGTNTSVSYGVVVKNSSEEVVHSGEYTTNLVK